MQMVYELQQRALHNKMKKYHTMQFSHGDPELPAPSHSRLRQEKDALFKQAKEVEEKRRVREAQKARFEVAEKPYHKKYQAHLANTSHFSAGSCSELN